MREIVFYEIVFLIGLFTSCRKRLFQSPKFYSLVSFMIFSPRKGLTSLHQVLFIWFTNDISHYRKGLLRSPKLYSLVKCFPPPKGLASLARIAFTHFAREFFPTNEKARFARQNPFTRFAREIFIHRVNLSPLTHGYSYIDKKYPKNEYISPLGTEISQNHLKSYGKSYPEPPGTHVAKVLNIILRPYFEHVGTSGDNTIVDKKINFPQSFFFNFYFF